MTPDSHDTRLLLFDVGGVLVELSGVAAIRDWRGELTAEDIWHLWFRSPAVREFETGRMEAEAFAIAMVSELQLAIAPDEFLTSFAQWPSRLYPGTLDLLARIPRRYRRALLSNSNAVHWPRVIDEFGLGNAVDDWFVSHVLGAMKPDDAAFEHVMRALDCKPEHILFFDDNLPNIDAARRLGMRAELVRGLAETEQALLKMGIFEERI